MEEILTIKGEITKIYRPIDGDFGFNDFALTSFMLKTKNKEYYLCCGESFPIFVSENVILEGKLTVNEKGKKFDFTSIKVDLNELPSKKTYLKHICGKATFEKILHGIIEDSNRVFYSIERKEEYAIDKFEAYLKEENYKMLTSISGIGEKTVQKICSKYKTNLGFEQMYTELAVYGLSLKDCNKLYKSKELKNRFQDNVTEVIKKNPYKLMEYVDFSFNKCDIFYSKQPNAKYNSVARILAAISYCIKAELGKGHTYSYKETIFNNTIKMLDNNIFGVNKIIDINEINSCFNALIANKRVIDDNGRIYLRYVFQMEDYIRNFCKRVLKMQPNGKDYKPLIAAYEEEKHIKFGKEQKIAIETSLQNQVSIITGGPGTGKTSSLAAVIKFLLGEGIYESDIALCAPTGKAAKRMMESINGSLGTDMIATTIHTLLEVDPTSPDLEKFVYNENNKLPKKVIVIDETSMLDLKIAYSLISAIKDTTRVIFVGDIEQLPPVGYGYFLRDIIESGVKCTKLLEIHRQKGDSSIISLSQKIRDEILCVHDTQKRPDFLFKAMSRSLSYEEKMKWIVDTFEKSVQKIGLDQTMILTPINGEVVKKNNPKTERFGGQQLCLAIQERILPHKDGEVEFEKNGWKFKIGSKVIVTKNDNAKGIVNGEIGYIESIDVENKKIDVDFEGRSVTLDEDNIDELRLAYAITVHKSQGSEWQNVIYCCFDETRMNKKPLVYTAITRAKKALLIVGDEPAFVGCIHNKEEYRRSRILN